MKKIKHSVSFFKTDDMESDWDDFCRENLPKVYNFFIYRTGNEHVAEDLTSVSFERAWRNRIRFRQDRSKLHTWLFGIARNVLREDYRAYRKRDEVDLEENAAGAALSMEQQTTLNEEKKWLASLINALPERERELISLKYGAGLTNREISKITRLSESNVGTILARTLQKIRKQKEEFDGR